jgi:hypothetical protein
LQIVKVRDAETTVLAQTAFPLTFEKKIAVSMTVVGQRITAKFDDVTLVADDTSDTGFVNGGIGLLVSEGALSTEEVRVSAA